MTGIIIQARMNSTRLPGKILMSIGKKLLLEHILFRLDCLIAKTKVVIATTSTPADDVVEAFCDNHNVDCFRGDEFNVLDRYYKCAVKYGFNDIVRMTGDNPFPDIEELDRLIAMHREHGNHYSECLSVLPIGLGTEIFSFAALESSYNLSTKPHHFEHVNEYIIENKADFKYETLIVPNEKNKPEVRLTVDTQEDFELICCIAESAPDKYITTQEAIRLCSLFV